MPGTCKALERFEGMQHKQVFHIHRDLVVKLLQQQRNTCMGVRG